MAVDPNTRRSIQHDMRVRDQDGVEIARTLKLDGDYLKVVTNGDEHWIPDDLIMRVEQDVFLNVSADEARTTWRDTDPSGHPRVSEAHERHERSEVKGERLHKKGEQRNDQQ